jgi:hypothetical protein
MNRSIRILSRRSIAVSVAVAAVLACHAGPVGAEQWRLENGTQVTWDTSITVGATWRANDPSNQLYSRVDGQLLGLKDGRGGSNTDSADLNYAAGDRVSTPLKLVTDLEVSKGGFGVLVRAKAWYDEALKNEDVRYGHQNNDYNGARGGYNTQNPLLPYNPCPGASSIIGGQPYCNPGTWPKARLNDRGFEDLQKFSGVYLLDAYVYGSFALGDTDLQLRLGNQVVNWGESVFIQGINQINPIDVPGARRPGVELKEVLLPVWMAYANWGLPVGSFEAFYQFKWDNTSVDACGTYWGPAEGMIGVDTAGCLASTSFGGAANPVAQAKGYYFPAFKGKAASNSGQFGVAYRLPVDAIDTEFGLYAMNIHARVPVISARMGTHPAGPVATPGLPFPIFNPAANGGLGGWFSGVGAAGPNYALITPAAFHVTLAEAGGTSITPGGGFWEYPEDIQIFGLTAATTLWGWSVAAETSYQHGVPVQINGNDLVQAALQGIGPYAAEGRAATVKGAGTYLSGYDRFDKTQFQANTVKTFSNILGAQNLLLVGEVGFQWNNVPDYRQDNIRYGRAFIYGNAGSPALAAQTGIASLAQQSCTAPVAALVNPQPDGCKNDGYVTSYAWGYRLRARLDYDGKLGGAVRVSPSLSWNHDVGGVSMDGQFIKGREALGLGLGFDYAKRYTMDLGYTWYANSAYNPLMDRDFYFASLGVSF